MPIKHS